MKSLVLPAHWREVIRQKMIEAAEAAGINQTTIERDKERLKLKHARTIKLFKDGYLTDEEFQGDIAAIELNASRECMRRCDTMKRRNVED